MSGAGYLYWLLCCSFASVGLAVGGWGLRACLLAFCTTLTVDTLRVAELPYREAVALDPLLNGGFLAVVAISLALKPRAYKVVLVASLVCQIALHFALAAGAVSPFIHAALNNGLWMVQAVALGSCVWAEVREAVRPIR